MTTRFPVRLVAALATLTAAFPAQAGQCAAASTTRTAALVELYTSEGCSSCPPADRWLSSLLRRGDRAPQDVVPIALHVDYWDYIGWKDPYAKREFSARQRRLAALQRTTFVYTPQVMLQGRDFRGWGSAAFDQAVTKINAQPAKAAITLTLERLRDDALEVDAAARVLVDPGRRDTVDLYLAAYESRLVSRVDAGENRGRTLTHDFVVRDWVGPLAFGANGRLRVLRSFPLASGAKVGTSGVVAFVQDRNSAAVLQALMLRACPG